MNKKNYNTTSQLISEMRYMLANNRPMPRRKMTLEGLVYGEDGEEMMGDDMDMDMDNGGMEAQGRQHGGQMPQQQQQQQMGGMQGEENPLDGDPEITQLITNIRVETLQGMTKLAENPESAQYELLKKIFLLVDKAVEDKVDPEKQGR